MAGGPLRGETLEEVLPTESHFAGSHPQGMKNAKPLKAGHRGTETILHCARYNG